MGRLTGRWQPPRPKKLPNLPGEVWGRAGGEAAGDSLGGNPFRLEKVPAATPTVLSSCQGCHLGRDSRPRPGPAPLWQKAHLAEHTHTHTQHRCTHSLHTALCTHTHRAHMPTLYTHALCTHTLHMHTLHTPDPYSHSPHPQQPCDPSRSSQLAQIIARTSPSFFVPSSRGKGTQHQLPAPLLSGRPWCGEGGERKTKSPLIVTHFLQFSARPLLLP